ncbi:hypothetical protein EDC01DRAFT_782444 [Geopyxis carbonaria]|nr:hypothetical protein EDC01DRAFT_782444 [Geopyxis carbonaria]
MEQETSLDAVERTENANYRSSSMRDEEAINFTPPKGPRDPQESIKKLQRTTKLSRDQRVVIQKAAKALAKLTTQNARLATATNRSLRTQLEDLKSKTTKKKIAVDKNSQFANIETIKLAMNEAQTKEKAVKAKELARMSRITEEDAAKEAAKVSKELDQAQMDACMFSWQLE